jgi:hypothetical protein
LFLVICNAKKRLGYWFKLVLALAILVILLSQLSTAVQQAAESYRRWMNRDHPHGNPVKVYQDLDSITIDSEDPLLKKLKIHRAQTQPED